MTLHGILSDIDCVLEGVALKTENLFICSLGTEQVHVGISPIDLGPDVDKIWNYKDQQKP